MSSNGKNGWRGWDVSTLEWARTNSLFVFFALGAALMVANNMFAAWGVDYHAYESFLNINRWTNPLFGERHDGVYHLTFHFLVNEMLFTGFMGFAINETVENVAPGGELSNPWTLAAVALMTVGGILGPIGVNSFWVYVMGQTQLASSWAVGTATDIALAYVALKMALGIAHRALKIGISIAVLDDLGAVLIIALAFSHGTDLRWVPLLLVAFGISLFLRFRVHKVRWFLIPTLIAWYGLFRIGIEPALAMLFVAPAMNKEHRVRFEHSMKWPTEIILGIFILANVGIPLASFSLDSLMIASDGLVGKFVGIMLTGLLAMKLFKGAVPVTVKELAVVSWAMGMGMTMATFIANVSSPPKLLAAIKMGILVDSLVAGVLANITARVYKLERVTVNPNKQNTSNH